MVLFGMVPRGIRAVSTQGKTGQAVVSLFVDAGKKTVAHPRAQVEAKNAMVQNYIDVVHLRVLGCQHRP